MSDTLTLNFLECFWALSLLHTVLSVPLKAVVALISDASFTVHLVVWWA